MMARFLLLLLTIMTAACDAASRLPAVPAADAERASVLGLANARFWPDRSPEPMVEEARQMLARRRAIGLGPSTNFLAISGGADNGAFGAGVMVGWTESGQRPVFDVVTGISAGALTAPMAFLGSQYDSVLQAVFTPASRGNIVVTETAGARLLFSDSLLDPRPLYALIARHADQSMLDAIAREYRRGRLMLIGTVNLDQQRPVIWNMGAIAASGHPQALALFRSILIASAAVPGIFPPVLIDVEHEGRRYQEMHVDGGAAAQVFLYPPSITVRTDSRAPRSVWVIRNDRLDPEWQTVPVGIFGITRRSIATMFHLSGLNDVVGVYSVARRDGLTFRLAAIGSDFTGVRGMGFDPTYMRELFNYARDRGRSGTAWAASPPGLDQVLSVSPPGRLAPAR